MERQDEVLDVAERLGRRLRMAPFDRADTFQPRRLFHLMKCIGIQPLAPQGMSVEDFVIGEAERKRDAPDELRDPDLILTMDDAVIAIEGQEGPLLASDDYGLRGSSRPLNTRYITPHCPLRHPSNSAGSAPPRRQSVAACTPVSRDTLVTHMNEGEAVAAVVAALPDATPVMSTTRDGATAVLVGRDNTELVVILSKDDGWRVPTMLGGSSERPTGRPAATDDEEPLIAVSTHQSAPGGPDARPSFGWLAVTGIAAEDAETLVVDTGIDVHEAHVREDGRVLALARAAWGATPQIHVKTSLGAVRVWL